MSSAPNLATPPARSIWRKWVIVGLGVAAGIGVAFFGWRAVRANQERAAALGAAWAGDFERAGPPLERALERRPGDAEVLEALARGYAKTGDPRGEALLTRWIDLQPDQAKPRRARMDYYRLRKEREKAYDDGRELLKFQPGDFDLRRIVMNLGFSTGHFAEAEELCRAGLRERPEDTGLLAMLAEIRRARGDAAGAAVLFDQILQKQPRNTGALQGRATLYEEAGQPEKAIPLLREVLRLDPRSRRTAGYQLSIDLERVGRTDEAQKVLREVRRLQDVEVFRGAIETQPDNLDLQVRLAKLLLDEGFTRDGLGLLDAVLKRDPHFLPAQQALAAHRRQAEGPP